MRSNEARKTHDEKGVRVAVVFSLIVLCFSLLPATASAEIVVFKNGRSMSVASCRIDEGTATMKLRSGGEATFPSSMIDRVDRDEVPYPDPAVGEPREAIGGPPVTTAILPDAILATRPYAGLIASLSAEYSLDARLVHAVIEQESNYQPLARSKKGAKGLMQLMPDTARQYGVRNSFDPKSNLDAGIRHLKDLLSRLELPTALAAYNAGEGTIKRYGGLPPFPETQTYVRNILSRLGRSSSN